MYASPLTKSHGGSVPTRNMSLEANIVNTTQYSPVSLTPESSPRLTLAQDKHGLPVTLKHTSHQSIEYISEFWNEMKISHMQYSII
jgi:hypothetical protein